MITSWGDLSKVIDAYGTPYKYIEQANYYVIWSADDLQSFNCTVNKSTPKNDDQIDFEDNYKAAASKELSIIESLIPKIFSSSIDTTVPASSNITLLDTSTEDINFGKCSYIMIRTNESDIDIELLVDGTQAYKLNLNDLKSDYSLREIDSIYVNNASQQFFDVYKVPFDFKDKIILKVYNNTDSNKKVLSYLIKTLVNI